MNKTRISAALLFIFLPSLISCAHQSNEKRKIAIEENIAKVDNELEGDIKYKKQNNNERYIEPQIQDNIKVIQEGTDLSIFEVVGTGTASKYERKIEAEKRAEEDALSKIVKRSGVNVYYGFQNIIEEYGNTEYSYLARYLNSWSSNLVITEPIGKAVYKDDPDGNTKVSVTIRGKVVFRGDADPSFEVKSSVNNNNVFSEGDGVLLKITVTKDAYISIYQSDEEGNIYLIFPNRYQKDSLLKSSELLELPGKYPFVLTTFLPKDRNETADILHIIATKEQPLFTLTEVKEANYSTFTLFSIGKLRDLQVRLAKLPRSQWTMQVIPYFIKKR